MSQARANFWKRNGLSLALAALDDKLIPKATTPAVKDHLATTREHVAHHLERAKALQK